MEAKHGASVSEAELNQSSKSLKATKTAGSTDSLDYDPAIAEKLAALYEQHDGDLRAIFDELDENPRKALKHPPASAADFGKRYAQGFYTYAEEK